VEPLEVSASLARSLALRHCAPRCRSYHGLWQFLRLLDLGKTMSGLSDVFMSEIAAEARRWTTTRSPEQPPRVLVSGCADYSAYAHLHAACAGTGADPSFTAVDLCETPLRLSEWFAERLGSRITTIRTDILDHATDEPYDLIVSSGFLGYFRGSVRLRLFETYARLLRPGGLLLVSNRLRDGDEDQPVGFARSAADEFALLVRERSAVLPEGLRQDALAAADWAADYADRQLSYPVNRRAKIEALLRDAGFDTDCSEFSGTKRSRAPFGGPTIADGASYLLVKARRRDGTTDDWVR
jgi:SAM-dependent methyltransferase